MDAMPELLTSVLISKTESTANNSKQKNKHYKKQQLLDIVDDITVDKNQTTLTEKTSSWAEKDRRSTNDRRKQIAKRGRWLESRDRTDRRRTDKGISITI